MLSNKTTVFTKGLRSVYTGKLYEINKFKYICETEEEKSVIDVVYDFEKIKAHIETEGWPLNNPGIWKYAPLLPLPLERTDCFSPLIVGDTPLYKINHSINGFNNVFVKDEGRNPTASLKDRASAVVVSMALFQNEKVITTASTGNAAAALCGNILIGN
eukprot:Anaeramoba_ignava/c20771_g1_i3.p2 GENE.c20771_g1_i3~~c20771_g1_i3.p2  ORF type:complete len:159 (+),score=44.43 c20771_g1_i3:1-477(+)